MNLKDILRAEKTDLAVSDWSNGRIPRSAFPQSLVKERWYRLGSAYSWRTVKFRANGNDCRILILINEEKSIFRARLGVERSGDMVIVCDHEWHASEPGWHCHINRNAVENTTAGQARSSAYKWPSRIVHGMFPVTRKTAYERVARVYRLSDGGSLL